MGLFVRFLGGDREQHLVIRVYTAHLKETRYKCNSYNFVLR